MKPGTNKYIFLDLDGVINTSASWKTKMYDIKDSCIETLAIIVQNTGAKIVLTSSWKTGFDVKNEDACTPQIKNLKEYLKPYGVMLYDKTPDWKGKRRDEEIDAYLKRNPFTQYVILDDDKSLFSPKTRNLYLVDAATGLQAKDIKAIQKFLK